jgi:hypothetical protein
MGNIFPLFAAENWFFACVVAFAFRNYNNSGWRVPTQFLNIFENDASVPKSAVETRPKTGLPVLV